MNFVNGFGSWTYKHPNYTECVKSYVNINQLQLSHETNTRAKRITHTYETVANACEVSFSGQLPQDQNRWVSGYRAMDLEPYNVKKFLIIILFLYVL